ncbi:MAG: NERD domain-containing protein, partial [Desulfobulbaceae bacterium]|nr:NERD domain-containing protein [Desulfobulbaceae bacterium]
NYSSEIQAFTLLPIAAFIILAMVISKRCKNFNLGLLGEEIVGQKLEIQLREFPYTVFHDIINESNGMTSNVDHLAIGPGGIIVVESKMRRKSGDERLIFNGKTIGEANGKKYPGPINQLK